MIIHVAGDDEEGEEGEEGGEGEEKMPTCGDYIMHFLTLFWKVLFAIIPPAGIKSSSCVKRTKWNPGVPIVEQTLRFKEL